MKDGRLSATANISSYSRLIRNKCRDSFWLAAFVYVVLYIECPVDPEKNTLMLKLPLENAMENENDWHVNTIKHNLRHPSTTHTNTPTPFVSFVAPIKLYLSHTHTYRQILHTITRAHIHLLWNTHKYTWNAKSQKPSQRDRMNGSFFYCFVCSIRV